MVGSRVEWIFYDLRFGDSVKMTRRHYMDAKIVRLKPNAMMIVGHSQYAGDDLQNAAKRIIAAYNNPKKYNNSGEQVKQDIHTMDRFFELAEKRLNNYYSAFGMRFSTYKKWFEKIQSQREKETC